MSLANPMTDPASERAVLAGLCGFGQDAYIDVADIVDASVFSDDVNKSLFRAIAHAVADGGTADYPSILAAAQDLRLGDALAGPEEQQYLRSIINFSKVVERGSVRRLAGRLRKLDIIRQMHATHGDVRGRLERLTGDEGIDQILATSEGPVLEMATTFVKGQDGPKALGEGALDYVRYLAGNQRQSVGISTGMDAYDRAIGGGVRPGTVNVIGARPKRGKSVLTVNFGVNIASGKSNGVPIPVCIADSEMMEEDQKTRAIACISGVDINEIEKGTYANDPRKKHAVEAAAASLAGMPLDFMSTVGRSFEEVIASLSRWVQRTVGLDDNGNARPCVIIYDYLKLTSSESLSGQNMAEFQVLGFMMTSLHNLAVRYKVPVVTFIQLNREGITREDTGVASGSDRIIWLCSNFTIFKEKTEEELAEDRTWNRKLVPVVARHGAGLDDGDYINVSLQGACARVKEGPTRNEAFRGRGAGPQKGIVVNDTDASDSVPFG